MDGWVRLAKAVLREWIVSGDPLHGDMWRLWCWTAGVDPEQFRRTATEMRKREGMEW
jgi:hypothetical protein